MIVENVCGCGVLGGDGWEYLFLSLSPSFHLQKTESSLPFHGTLLVRYVKRFELPLNKHSFSGSFRSGEITCCQNICLYRVVQIIGDVKYETSMFGRDAQPERERQRENDDAKEPPVKVISNLKKPSEQRGPDHSKLPAPSSNYSPPHALSGSASSTSHA